ncbi:MAG: TonB C-terminal domain-containing protein [Desulfobacterales bacterium]|nr:TonB C-terminal domain-containing protein [Desulfobacterales bacterium]
MASHDLPPPPPSPQKRSRRGQSGRRRNGRRPGKRDSDPGREADADEGPAAGQEAGERRRSRSMRSTCRRCRTGSWRRGPPRSGGLSFNTYDWDFAPYMLALKERISRNIFPPLAFSQLGMIDGDTMLRFKIYPDGRLADLELLGYTGHRTLMETSRFAVTTSAPFPTLPADFPKSYLEVTAKFSYFVKR